MGSVLLGVKVPAFAVILKLLHPPCVLAVRNGYTREVSLHAPGSGRATNHESLAGAFGIPDFKSPPAMGLSK